MPTITLDRAVFEKLVGKKFSDDQLKDRIAMLGTDLESVDKKEIVVEVFPNRPDLLSEQGFARAFSAFVGQKKGLRSYSVKKSGHKVIVDKSVTMRPYTVCALVKGVKFTDERIREIMQMQEKLSTTHGRRRKKSEYGIYPSDKINFPVTYIAKDPKKVMFQPLGMDKKIRADKVEELHPTGQEFGYVAQGWTKYPFFIDAQDNVLSMLPYTNSHDIGKIDESTKDVFVECTGTNLENVHVALNILVTTLSDMGGDIYSIDVVYPDQTISTPRLDPTEMVLDEKYINRILGLDLKKTEMIILLERMGFGYKNGIVLVPSWRPDIIHQIDLAEDVAIAFGYEYLPEEIPRVATVAEESPLSRFVSTLSEIFVGANMQEVSSYHLLSESELGEKMGESTFIRLVNALGDYNSLRNTILPSLLKTLTHNQHNDYPQRIFEEGMVFLPDKKVEDGVYEQRSLGVALCYDKADLTSARQIVDLVGRSLGLEFSVKEIKHNPLIDGRAASVLVGKTVVGVFGEVHPAVLEKWGLGMPVASVEFNVDVLFDIVKKSI
jgi:phenylalanyl-tRNA synthetase beta chain